MNEQQLQTLRSAIDAHRTAMANDGPGRAAQLAAIQNLQYYLYEYKYGTREGQLSHYAVKYEHISDFDQHLYDEPTGRWHPTVGDVPGWAVLPIAPLL